MREGPEIAAADGQHEDYRVRALSLVAAREERAEGALLAPTGGMRLSKLSVCYRRKMALVLSCCAVGPYTPPVGGLNGLKSM